MDRRGPHEPAAVEDRQPVLFGVEQVDAALRVHVEGRGTEHGRLVPQGDPGAHRAAPPRKREHRRPLPKRSEAERRAGGPSAWTPPRRSEAPARARPPAAWWSDRRAPTPARSSGPRRRRPGRRGRSRGGRRQVEPHRRCRLARGRSKALVPAGRRQRHSRRAGAAIRRGAHHVDGDRHGLAGPNQHRRRVVRLQIGRPVAGGLDRSPAHAPAVAPPIPIAVARTTATPPRARIRDAPPREGPREGRHGGKAGKADPRRAGEGAPGPRGKPERDAGYSADGAASIGRMGEQRRGRGGYCARGRRRDYFEADSDEPSAAWPAARRAVSTRNGEQDT